MELVTWFIHFHVIFQNDSFVFQTIHCSGVICTHDSFVFIRRFFEMIHLLSHMIYLSITWKWIKNHWLSDRIWACKRSENHRNTHHVPHRANAERMSQDAEPGNLVMPMTSNMWSTNKKLSALVCLQKCRPEHQYSKHLSEGLIRNRLRTRQTMNSSHEKVTENLHEHLLGWQIRLSMCTHVRVFCLYLGYFQEFVCQEIRKAICLNPTYSKNSV